MDKNNMITVEENKEKNVGEYTYKTEQIAVCVGEK
jgi:hypothetical protein